MIRIKDKSFTYDYDFWCVCDCVGKSHAMGLEEIIDEETGGGVKRTSVFRCNHCLGKVTFTMLVETRAAVCVDISNA